ncbi:2-hydroxyacid dehydrogenase [Thalassotalea sp. 1_MG-2023]|uniref:2-hydroxyacid dehydrogenase n=1 Tax=Thalassotalea sp. 1_MG-2023 TaxID=3062680 RepID=UPI0026E4366C|nr:2-hydroxyacid dehydrogenase [Thalassotalea sp. 1_MG-2023]MDO6426873.1 2-hydroxyacid dehydrogenase [Thalassotalea sp. 1_MG-2023]
MLQVTVFSAKKYDIEYLNKFNASDRLVFKYIESRLSAETVTLAKGAFAVCVFVNDIIDNEVLNQLNSFGVNIIALRCAGYNNIELTTAKKLGFTLCRVPVYSPEAVAEHTVGLMLTLSRKYHKAYNRVREGNFSLDGLVGFNLHHKTVGIIGTGNIGLATIKILRGFGCRIICTDPYPNDNVIKEGGTYVTLTELLTTADIISLHCPLNKETKHLINTQTIDLMKNGVMLINTSRGALIESQALIGALKAEKISLLGLDVYELESEIFFEDLSETIINDDVFERLLTFPNVLITGHQGFFTQEALETIAKTTINNLLSLSKGELSGNEL